MIQINCTNCKSLLQIDDAFAGGVCRCKHCGTIQTVPKRLKSAAVAGEPAAATAGSENGGGPSSSSKSLYQRRGAIDAVGSGTGLDDLAGIVASSGLSSSRLQKKSAPPPVKAAPGPVWDKKIVAVVGSAGGLIVLLLGVIIFMAVRDRTGEPQPVHDNVPSPPVASGGNEGKRQPVPAPANSPAFLGQAITEPSVAFVLDRGNFSKEEGRFQLMRQALVNSLKSLTPDQQFQVVFWNVEKERPFAWPAGGMLPATPQNIAECREKLIEPMFEGGVTEEKAALETALKSRPEAIVLVPIKGLNDQHAFASRVISQRAAANSKAKIYCFSLAQADWGVGLNLIAKSTGGEYRDVRLDELRRFAGE
jgi:hypothetical protein